MCTTGCHQGLTQGHITLFVVWCYIYAFLPMLQSDAQSLKWRVCMLAGIEMPTFQCCQTMVLFQLGTVWPTGRPNHDMTTLIFTEYKPLTCVYSMKGWVTLCSLHSVSGASEACSHSSLSAVILQPNPPKKDFHLPWAATRWELLTFLLRSSSLTPRRFYRNHQCRSATSISHIGLTPECHNKSINNIYILRTILKHGTLMMESSSCTLVLVWSNLYPIIN